MCRETVWPWVYERRELAHIVVLQQDVVVFRSVDQRIERIGPWPRFFTIQEIIANCCPMFYSMLSL